jgi:Rrf2 family protein
MMSQRARYAFKAVCYLAGQPDGRPAPSREIAERNGIPQPFLEQILTELARAGIVETKRGKAGGHRLKLAADDIFCGQLLRLVDGPIAPLPCLSRTAYRRCDDCPDEGACTLRHLFSEAYDAFITRLEETSIAGAMRASDALS